MGKPRDPKDINVVRNLNNAISCTNVPDGIYVKAIEVNDGIAREFCIRFNDFDDFMSVVRSKGEPRIFY